MLGGQFDWGGRLLKSNGGVQRFAQLERKSSKRVAAVLDDVSASSFLQVLEQTAAQNDVDVRTSCDIKTAVSTAVQISRFIHYYDKLIEVSIVPAPREEGLTLEEVTKVAEGAGFVSASGRWELRIDEGSREQSSLISIPLSFARRLATRKRWYSLPNTASER